MAALCRCEGGGGRGGRRRAREEGGQEEGAGRGQAESSGDQEGWREGKRGEKGARQGGREEAEGRRMTALGAMPSLPPDHPPSPCCPRAGFHGPVPSLSFSPPRGACSLPPRLPSPPPPCPAGTCSLLPLLSSGTTTTTSPPPPLRRDVLHLQPRDAAVVSNGRLVMTHTVSTGVTEVGAGGGSELSPHPGPALCLPLSSPAMWAQLPLLPP